jgi:hypothetical protein
MQYPDLFLKKKYTCITQCVTKSNTLSKYVISGFRREVDENCALVGYYAASGGSFLPTFRDNLTVPSSWVKNPKKKS